MGPTSLHLATWTHDGVHAEWCAAYSRYSHALGVHYAAYFAAHAEPLIQR